MYTTRTMGWAAVLALGAAVGCSHSSSTPPPAAPPSPPAAETSPTAEAATPPQASRPTPRTGAQQIDPAAALLAAADQLSLTQSQRSTLGTLQEGLRASGREIVVALRSALGDLAAQVRTGSIDPARVQADESVVTQRVQSHITREIDVLNGLHTALDPTQRAAAVAAVRSEQPGSAEEQAMPEGPSDRAARLDRLTRELGLDADQQQRAAALLSEQPPGPEGRHRAEHERRFDQVISAFANDQFDAQTTLQGFGQSPVAMIHEWVQRETGFLSRLLPILRPDQRDELASKIEGRGWGPESQKPDSRDRGPDSQDQGSDSPGQDSDSDGQE